MKEKLWAVILIAIILGADLPVGSYAQEDFYRIMKLVRLRAGKLESIEWDSENLVEIRDAIGRDRTPEGGVKERTEIIPGCYVHCGPGISAALQTSNDEVFWMNSNTIVQIGGSYIRANQGEIYTGAKRLKLEVTNGVVIEPKDGDFYLKASREETLLYLFNGRINIESYILDKEKPFARISTEGIESFSSDRLPQDFEERARMWRRSIRSLIAPFWMKPAFYVPTAAIAVGVTTAVAFYLTREREAEVIFNITMP